MTLVCEEGGTLRRAAGKVGVPRQNIARYTTLQFLRSVQGSAKGHRMMIDLPRLCLVRSASTGESPDYLAYG